MCRTFSAWGIDEKYRDDSGRWHEVSDATKNKFLSVMQATQEGPVDPALLVVRQGADVNVPESCELAIRRRHPFAVRLETSAGLAAWLPFDL